MSLRPVKHNVALYACLRVTPPPQQKNKNTIRFDLCSADCSLDVCALRDMFHALRAQHHPQFVPGSWRAIDKSHKLSLGRGERPANPTPRID